MLKQVMQEANIQRSGTIFNGSFQVMTIAFDADIIRRPFKGKDGSISWAVEDSRESRIVLQ